MPDIAPAAGGVRYRHFLAGAATRVRCSRDVSAQAMTQLLCTYPATGASPLEDGCNKCCLLAEVMFALSLSRGSDATAVGGAFAAGGRIKMA